MRLGKAARRLPSPNGLYGRLASLAARRWASLILIGAIVAMDRSLPWQGWGFAVRASLDEPCHVATGLVCLGAITRFRGRPPAPGFGWAMLICSTAIDLDHLPLALGSSVLTAGTPRPYTHALWVVAVLALGALAAWCWPRRAGRASPAAAASIMLGAACGVSAHFLRDAGTAAMSLWWPVTPAAVQVHYRWYAVAIVVIALMPATWPSRPSRATGPPRPATSRHEPRLPGDFSDPVRPGPAGAGTIRVGCRMARVITRERFLGGSSAQYGTPKSRREQPALSTGREANH
jgi:inner membrane protein